MKEFDAVERWIEEERKNHAIAHERRMKNEAMRRISAKYKRIHSYSEYVLSSVYTYSFAGLFK